MTDETKPDAPTLQKIVLHSESALTDVQVISALIDATAERTADVIAKWADDSVAVGQPVTAADIDGYSGNVLARFTATLGRSLSRRNSPGIAMLRAVTATRNETAAAVRSAPVMVPEYQEVETAAKFDESGRMTGTLTKKQLVRR